MSHRRRKSLSDCNYNFLLDVFMKAFDNETPFNNVVILLLQRDLFGLSDPKPSELRDI